MFNDVKKSDEDIADYFKIPVLDKDKWNLSLARRHLAKTGIISSKLIKIHYRPFDSRIIYFDEVLVARLVKNIMGNLKGNNKAIICGRAGLNVNGDDWNLVTICDSPTDLNLFSRGGATVFPIYISPAGQIDDSSLLIPNFKPEFLKSLYRN